MTAELSNTVTDAEIIAACKAGCFHVTPESAKNMRKVLESFLVGRAQRQVEPLSRADWMAQAQTYYLEAGDDEATARQCARYICNQQDWAGGDVGDPREQAQEDVHGRGRTEA